MDLSKYKKSADGRFISIPTTIKLPVRVASALLKVKETTGTPVARQIAEILQKHFKDK